MNYKPLLILCVFMLIGSTFLLQAQAEEKEQKFGINFGGFVKNDIFYDTRQTFSLREGHFNLFPENVKKDPVGKDINSTPNFNMLAIQTRLTGRITGPDAFGAKTSGMIEGEFFGTANSDVNGFRMRHAFVKFEWEKSELLSGHTWHPLFVAQAFPEVLSFNTGVPFKPFSRNPQIRYTYKTGAGINIIATAYTLREFATPGPPNQITFERNPGFPSLNIAFTYVPQGSQNIFGAGADYKTVMPEIETDLGYKTNSTLSSMSATAFAKLVFDKVTFKLQGVYSQNAANIMGIGGYAVLYNTYDTLTGTREYTNLNTGTMWTEIYYKGENFIAGLFAGYTLNMGSSDKMDTNFHKFARGSNIEYIYRVAPRLAFVQGRSTIGLEIEYTAAAYGKPENINDMGEFSASEEVANIRTLLSFIYNF